MSSIGPRSVGAGVSVEIILGDRQATPSTMRIYQDLAASPFIVPVDTNMSSRVDTQGKFPIRIPELTTSLAEMNGSSARFRVYGQLKGSCGCGCR